MFFTPMESPVASFSLSSLLCEEDESSFSKVIADDLNAPIDSNKSYVVFNNDEEYLQILLSQEIEFQSHTGHFDKTISKWLKTSRLDAIDWISNTGEKFGFSLHTICLSVNYFDRFISRRSIKEGERYVIQLLSVTCLSLAAKMEEHDAPSLSEFPIEECCIDNVLIGKMELFVLETLDWKMASITPFTYLHLPCFFEKLCVESKSEGLVSRASHHIMAFIKDANLMDYRPSIIASTAILAALDSTLTRNTMDLRIRWISSWRSSENELVFFCYNQMKELERRKIMTPDSSLASTSSTGVVEDPSLLSSGSKRKLTF